MTLGSNHTVFFREEFFGAVVYNSSDKEYYFFDREIADEYREFIRTGIAEKEFLSELEENNLLTSNTIVISKAHSRSFSAPLRVFLDLTYNCNLCCKHCFTDSCTQKESELTTKEIFSLIDQMREAGSFLLSIGGGEPLIREDLFEILEYAKKNDIDPSITTNGLLITEEIAKKLHDCGMRTITISLDGLENTHEALRGPKTFQRVLSKIALLKKHCRSARIAIRNTINKLNVHEYKEFLNLVEGLGVDIVKFNPIRCFGRARENRQLLLKCDEYTQFIKNVSACKCSLQMSLPKTPLDREEYNFVESGFGCTGGKETCNITPTGEFSPCAFLGDDYVVGSIKDESFLSLWRKANEKTEFQGNSTCNSCDKYKQCRAGCRSRALFEYGSIDAIDTMCVLNKALLNRLTIRREPAGFVVYNHEEKQYKKYNSFEEISTEYRQLVENRQYRMIETKGNLPLKIFFDPTNACNSRCIHCYNNSAKALENEISLAEVEKVAKELYDLGICQVSIAGGEPLVRKEIFSMIDVFTNYGQDISITTNGILLRKEMVERLAISSVSSLTISIDALSRERYREVRGVDGFEEILSNLEFLRTIYKGDLSMRYSVMRGSEEPKEVLKFAQDQGFSTLKVNKAHLLGRFQESNGYHLADEDYDAIVHQFYEESRAFEVELQLPREKYLNGTVLPCSAGKKTVYISSQGEVFPCPFTANRFLFGSLRKNSLATILEINKLFSVDNSFCHNCPAMKKSHGITKKSILK